MVMWSADADNIVSRQTEQTELLKTDGWWIPRNTDHHSRSTLLQLCDLSQPQTKSRFALTVHCFQYNNI